jgi:hypothetical protein
MTYNDVPVLVDFGFAKKHELGSPGRFLSTVRMGTPEVSCNRNFQLTFSILTRSALLGNPTTSVPRTCGLLG